MRSLCSRSQKFSYLCDSIHGRITGGHSGQGRGDGPGTMRRNRGGGSVPRSRDAAVTRQRERGGGSHPSDQDRTGGDGLFPFNVPEAVGRPWRQETEKPPYT